METVTSKRKMTTANMTVTALMTAITCILGPLSLPIPISPVPISLTNLVIYFMAYVLGAKLSVISYMVTFFWGWRDFPYFRGFPAAWQSLRAPQADIWLALFSWR